VFRRFSRWSIKGVWWRIFEAMSDDPDFEYLIVDSTIWPFEAWDVPCGSRLPQVRRAMHRKPPH
jgi:hypothetical protein